MGGGSGRFELFNAQKPRPDCRQSRWCHAERQHRVWSETFADYEGNRLSSVLGPRFVGDARPTHGRQVISTTNESRFVSVHETGYLGMRSGT